MPDVENPNHSHLIWRPNNGITACSSPIYMVYPVEKDGTRPSTHTLLQYTSPEDRSFQESFRSQQEIEFETANKPVTESHSALDSAGESDQDRDNSPARSSQESQSGASHPSPRRTSTLLWYCCRRCVAPGPYLSFYERCVGCETPRCDNCEVESVSVKEEEIRV